MTKRSFDPEAIMTGLSRGELGCGDLEMRIDRNGSWYYRGSRIERPALVKLFATVLHRAEDGVYWLITPVERGRVEVEDAPFTAVAAEISGSGQDQIIQVRTNLDDEVTIGPSHPLTLRDGPAGSVPYLLVRGRLEARLLPGVFYGLVEHGVSAADDPSTIGVWSAGVFFALGRWVADGVD